MQALYNFIIKPIGKRYNNNPEFTYYNAEFIARKIED